MSEEETPITRLKILVELLEKFPQDIEIIMELAETDPEIMKKLSELIIKLMNIPYTLQREIAKKAIRLGIR